MSISSIALAVSLLFTGDILLDRGVRDVIDHLGIDHLFTQEVDSLFHSCDYVIGNLECPATNIHQPDYKLYVFRADPVWLPALKAHGITHLNLANNHSIDQGRAGLVDTWQNIWAAGIIPFGAGNTMEEAVTPLVLKVPLGSCTSPQCSDLRNIYVLPTLRLALENFSYLTGKPCVSQEPEDSLLARIHRIRTTDPSACIIVCPHWGAEHRLRPMPMQQQLAHKMIDAGADMIIGHHPHTLQTIGEYRSKPIYYSIGNFIFDQQRPINSRACVVKVTVGADTLHAETIPVTIQRCVPHLDNT